MLRGFGLAYQFLSTAREGELFTRTETSQRRAVLPLPSLMAMPAEEDAAEVAMEAPIGALPSSRSKSTEGFCSQQHPWLASGNQVFFLY